MTKIIRYMAGAVPIVLGMQSVPEQIEINKK